MKNWRWSLLMCLALLLVSCISDEDRLAKANENLGSKKNPIKMFFVPSLEVSSVLISGEAIARELQAETGYHFKVAVPTVYASVVEAIGAYKADVVWMPTFGYILAKEKYDAQIKFMTVRNGLNKYCGQFVTRTDSDIATLEDIGGKIIAYTDGASTSGYIYPSAILQQKGIKPAKYIFAGGHQQAIFAVYNGQADVACTYWSPPDPDGKPKDAREKVLQTYPDVFEKIRIVALTDSIPNDTVTFRKQLPTQVEKRLTEALAKFAARPKGKKILASPYDIGGLIPATDKDYDIVRNTLKTLGKDPREYFK